MLSNTNNYLHGIFKTLLYIIYKSSFSEKVSLSNLIIKSYGTLILIKFTDIHKQSLFSRVFMAITDITIVMQHNSSDLFRFHLHKATHTKERRTIINF